MSARDFYPRFSINFDGEAFPGEEVKNQLGYEPDAAYLIDQSSGYQRGDTSMVVEGESSDDFLNNLENDSILVFRYRNKAIADDVISSKDLTGAPIHQYEGVEASIEYSPGFNQLVRTLGEELDGPDTNYMKQLLLPADRPEPLKNYSANLSKTNISVFPSEKGIAEIEIDAVEKIAEISRYNHKLETPRVPDAADFSLYTAENERGLTEINYEYSENNIESLEEFMQSLGFYTDVEVLPSTILPSELS